MEINPLQIGVQSAMGLAGIGAYKLWQKRAKSKKIIGLVLSTGKTNLCKMSDRYNIFIDLDEYLKCHHKEVYEKYKEDDIGFMVNLFPEVDKYLAVLYKSFSNRRLFLVSSHFEMLEQLEIKKIYAYLPSKDILTSINPPNPKLELKGHIISEKCVKKYVFNTWYELKEKIRKKFRIKQILNV